MGVNIIKKLYWINIFILPSFQELVKEEDHETKTNTFR
jgi:hypothetical protein